MIEVVFPQAGHLAHLFLGQTRHGGFKVTPCGQSAQVRHGIGETSALTGRYRVPMNDAMVVVGPGLTVQTLGHVPRYYHWCPTCIGRAAERLGLLGDFAKALAAAEAEAQP